MSFQVSLSEVILKMYMFLFVCAMTVDGVQTKVVLDPIDFQCMDKHINFSVLHLEWRKGESESSFLGELPL